MKPETTRLGIFDMQVCVPDDFTNQQVIDFAESDHPCGTTHGWSIRKEGDEALSGSPERAKCLEREGCVHVMLDA